MLRFLTGRECGDDPLVLRRAETTRRSFALDLSRHQDIEGIHKGPINSLDIDPVEGRYLISGGYDGTIGIHDLENFTGEIKHTCKSVSTVDCTNRHAHKKSVETVHWYPLDTGMFTSSGTDNLLKVWDTNNLVTADEYEFKGIVYDHAHSPIATKHCLVSVACQSSTLRLVDLKSGSATHTLKGHRSPVLCTSWSTKEEFILASGSQDNHVLIWDIRSGKGPLKVLDQYNVKEITAKVAASKTAHAGSVNGLQFTADGLHLLTFGNDHRLRLWNISNGKNTLRNYGKIRNDSKKTVQFAITHNCMPDLVFMPCGSDIEMYDMYKGVKIDTLRGHYMRVNCCIYHPDKQMLYSGGSDRNILVWTPDTNTVYEEYLNEKNKASSDDERPVLGDIAAATLDSWSSDEEN